MRKEIGVLKKRIERLEDERRQPNTTKNLRAVNEAASDAKERERRSKNVVVRGIQPSLDGNPEHDKEQVVSFLHAVCPEAKVKKVHRLHHATQKDDTSKRNQLSSILVVLEDAETQKRVLKVARHHSVEQFQGVFAHQDRTQAQQLQFAECSKLARDKNKQLEADGLLDQPFRFVVRGDRARCIDTIKSRENKSSCYVSEQDIKKYLNDVKRVNYGLANGTMVRDPPSQRKGTSGLHLSPTEHLTREPSQHH